jgi:Porin PorA
MRARVAGWTLTALGVLALAVAVLVTATSSAPAEVLPLAEEYETVTEGADVTFLDPVTLEQRTDEDVATTVRVRGITRSRDADVDTAVRRFDTTTRAADGTVIAPTTTTTACLDRRTAEAVDCSSAGVDGERADVRGLTVAFPPGAPARDGMMWDGTVQASFPVRYVGDEEFRGLDVRRYEQRVPEQVLRPVSVAGALLASDQDRAPADLWYGVTRTLLVEPVSGVVVSTEEVPLTTLRAPDGTPGPVILGGAFRPSEETVTGAVARAREVLDRPEASGGAVPWIAGGTGVVLLALGGLLVARGRQRQGSPVPDTTTPTAGAARHRVPVA